MKNIDDDESIVPVLEKNDVVLERKAAEAWAQVVPGGTEQARERREIFAFEDQLLGKCFSDGKTTTLDCQIFADLCDISKR